MKFAQKMHDDRMRKAAVSAHYDVNSARCTLARLMKLKQDILAENLRRQGEDGYSF
jgi:hypothetical protein